MKLYNKVKLVNNIIVRVTSEYNQIVLPSSMHNIVYTELHKNGSSNYWESGRPNEATVLLAKNAWEHKCFC